MHKKMLIAIILIIISAGCYTAAFAFFFDYHTARVALEKGPAGPFLTEIRSVLKEGFHAPTGCKPSDFTGGLRRIVLNAVSADIRVAGSSDTLPSINTMDSVSCERVGDTLRVNVPAFSRLSLGGGHAGDNNSVKFAMSAEIPKEMLFYLPEKQDVELEIKTVSGNVNAQNFLPKRLAVETRSGNIAIKGVAGDINLNALSGNITAALPVTPLELHANAASGDISVSVSGGGAEAMAESISGKVSIALPAATQPNQHIKAKTISGDIRIMPVN